MSLGLCCQWLDSNRKNKLKCRSLQKGRFERGLYDKNRIFSTYVENLVDLHNTLEQKIIPAGIRVFRYSSSLFPLWDLVPENTWNNNTVRNLLKQVGELADANGVRLTTHPSQYFVLNSSKPKVRDTAIKEVEFQSLIMDWMGLSLSPYNAINLHGGAKGNADILISSIQKLSENAYSRLTLENCERAWSTYNLVWHIYAHTGVPIVFDSHHWKFLNNGGSARQAMKLAMCTWPKGIRPLTHISTSPPERPGHRSHSFFLEDFPDFQLQANNSSSIDVDVEAKGKNLAIFKAAEDFDVVI